MPTQAQKQVHIIGGGIIGMSVAYHLAGQAQVRVYELDPAYKSSSFARSCGGLRAQFSTHTNIALSKHSIDFIKTVTPVPFTPNGYLMLFHEHQRSDHDQSLLLQQQLGTSTQSLDTTELSVLHPYLNLDDVYRGCVTLDGSEGWIDPVLLHAWYKAQAQALGVQMVYADGTQVNHDAADAVVFTAGCWTAQVAKPFGLDIPVRAHKHTVYQVSTEKPVLAALPLVADLITGIYLRPEGPGYIVGYDGNGEYDSDNLDPDYLSWDRVWELLYHRFPNHFDAAKMTGAWAGYYDTCALDNNALIDHVGKYFFATGFTGRGLMHSPAVGLAMSEMILEKHLTFDLSAYKLNRTPNLEKYVI